MTRTVTKYHSPQGDAATGSKARRGVAGVVTEAASPHSPERARSAHSVLDLTNSAKEFIMAYERN